MSLREGLEQPDKTKREILTILDQLRKETSRLEREGDALSKTLEPILGAGPTLNEDPSTKDVIPSEPTLETPIGKKLAEIKNRIQKQRLGLTYLTDSSGI